MLTGSGGRNAPQRLGLIRHPHHRRHQVANPFLGVIDIHRDAFSAQPGRGGIEVSPPIFTNLSIQAFAFPERLAYPLVGREIQTDHKKLFFQQLAHLSRHFHRPR